MKHSISFDLLSFDPEIKCTCRRLSRGRRKALHDQQLIMIDKAVQEKGDARLTRDYFYS